MCLQLMKEENRKITTCNRLDLETLDFRSIFIIIIQIQNNA